MPIPLTEGELVEITTRGLADGQLIENVIHYRVDEIVGAIDMDDALADFATVWEGSVVANLSDSYEIQQYEMRRVTGIDPAFAVGPYTYDALEVLVQPAPVPGGVAGAALPTYVAMSIRKIAAGPSLTLYISPNTPAASYPGEKRFKGGLRFGPIPETYTEAADQNKLTAAFKTVGQGMADALQSIAVVNGANLTTLDMCVASRQLDLAGREDTIATRTVVGIQLVTQLLCHPYVGSQVSRKRRPSGIGGS